MDRFPWKVLLIEGILAKVALARFDGSFPTFEYSVKISSCRYQSGFFILVNNEQLVL